MNVKNLKDFIAIDTKIHSQIISEETGWSSEVLRVILASEETENLDNTLLSPYTIRNICDRLKQENSPKIYTCLQTLFDLPINFIDELIKLDWLANPKSRVEKPEFMELSL